MAKSSAVLVVGALLAGSLAVASPAVANPAAARLSALPAGGVLVSPNGAYRAQLKQGRLVVRTKAGRTVWASTRKRTAATSVVLDRRGNLRLTKGKRTYWSTRTSGAGSAVLTLRNNGTLALTASRLLVWDTRHPTVCPRTRGKTFVVDISSQFARMCSNGNQVRATAVTTGASAKGYGTPRGSWRIYAKVRKTVLRPAAGGAYKVKYWVPYDGPYGVHDSSWQKFAYGSGKYRTRGSHGCTHVPARAMAWFFHWAKVGTRVTVKR